MIRHEPLPIGQPHREKGYTNTATCGSCGNQYSVGDWPFCPHGYYHQTTEFTAVFDEHISEEGAYITSHGQRQQIMRRERLDYRGKKMGMPGCEV